MTNVYKQGHNVPIPSSFIHRRTRTLKNWNHDTKSQSFIKAHFTKLKCDHDILHLQQDTVIYIFNNTESPSSRRICGIFLQGSECYKDDPSLEWTVNVHLGHKPVVKRTDNTKAEVTVNHWVHVKLLNEKEG